MQYFFTKETQSLLPFVQTPDKSHKEQSSALASLKFPLCITPDSWHPYMELIRLEKPTGTKLMFWPFAWGLTMAMYSSQRSMLPGEYALQLIHCLFSAFIMRSSACTINDIFDREMDASVERCKHRPLASGRVTVRGATLYLAIQYFLGTLYFYKTLDRLAFFVALFQLLPLFAIYPLLKRVTYWPQAWLGLAMNFGFITAWVSITDQFDYGFILVAMVGCWCWTMLYDTIYACQDIVDDLKAGVHSTAILFGTWIEAVLVGCACIFVGTLFTLGVLNQHGPAYFVLSVGGTALHFIWQFYTVNLKVPSSCWQNFNRNGELGWIVWGGIMIDYVLACGAGGTTPTSRTSF